MFWEIMNFDVRVIYFEVWRWMDLNYGYVQISFI